MFHSNANTSLVTPLQSSVTVSSNAVRVAKLLLIKWLLFGTAQTLVLSWGHGPFCMIGVGIRLFREKKVSLSVLLDSLGLKGVHGFLCESPRGH